MEVVNLPLLHIVVEIVCGWIMGYLSTLFQLWVTI